MDGLKEKSIVIVNHNAGSPHHGPNFRSYYAAKGWVGQGATVTVVCSSFSHKLKNLPQFEGDYLFEWIDGIQYLWLKGPQFKGNAGRAKSFLVFWRQLRRLPELISGKVDFVLCSSPPPLWVSRCRRFAELKNAKLIFEARDLWPDVIIETSKSGKLNPLVWLMRQQEKLAYKTADAVVSVNWSAIKVMKKRGLEENKFFAISNGASLHDSSNRPSSIGPLEIAEAKHDFLVGYSGALSRVYLIHHFLEASRILEKEGIGFVLIGTGPLASAAQNSQNFQKNLYTTGWIDKKNLSFALSKLSVCFTGLLDVPSFSYGSDSTKLYEYMKASRPIIQAVRDDDAVVNQARCGIRVDPSGAESIAEGVLKLKEMKPWELAGLGANGRKFLEEHRSEDAILSLWERLFSELEKRDKESLI